MSALRKMQVFSNLAFTCILVLFGNYSAKQGKMLVPVKVEQTALSPGLRNSWEEKGAFLEFDHLHLMD